jgi:AAA15 family ATPase/GTPase
MLCTFKVKGFKGFDNEIILDFKKHNEYQFNKNLIKNGIINKSIIYGKNGSGKTNIGFALFDLTFHLTDKNRNMESTIASNYLNMDGNHKYAEFYYEFTFGEDTIIYKYKKENLYKILYEEVLLNDKKIIEYEFSKPETKIIDIEEAQTLNWKYNDDDLSVVKYICNNTILTKNKALTKMMDFVNSMLWFRSVDTIGFIGLRNNSNVLDKIIIENGKTKEFGDFLEENGLKYDLIEIQVPNGKILGIKKGNAITTFESIISSGTKALWLYYCWEIYFEKVKFLFIDEFDATYHFELAAKIVTRLNKQSSFQSVLTSHNTYLMSNKLTRPDCTFILTNEYIKPLSMCTDKELREAHNIEKLYREGAFTD